MNYLFKKSINNWDDWGAVFQSISDFRELIKKIYLKEGLLGYDDISNLTPGTNAVFKAGKYAIKIFAPKESGANTDSDYRAELKSMQKAINMGLNAPTIVAASSIQDKYLFRYLIMDYIDGQEANKVLKNYSNNKKKAFVNKLRNNLHKLNIKPRDQVNGNLIQERIIKNKRWTKFNDSIKEQIIDIVMNYKLSEYVYVHGDLIGDNIIIDSKDNIFIIDYADSIIAPVEYEYPPMAFDLFNFDTQMIHEYFKDLEYDTLVEKLFIGTLMHEFGSYFVEIIYNKCTNDEVSNLLDIKEIKNMIYSLLKA
ncbi:phosphotransferase [Clostridiaceae bacterium M8S5]|nr:phosphotransferase [Clostridiaceae bacterium M8S5]